MLPSCDIVAVAGNGEVARLFIVVACQGAFCHDAALVTSNSTSSRVQHSHACPAHAINCFGVALAVCS